jgi:hypothetical protein
MDNDIHKQLDAEFAEAWKPKPGTKIVGVITDVTARDSGYGEYPIVTLEVAGGDRVALHCFHEVLRGELARIAPKLGDEIGVKYLGQHPEKGYHQYKVARAGTGSFDWARFSDEDAVEEVKSDDVPF